MKTSLTRLKSSFFLAALLALPAWAAPVAQVTEVTGSVFVVTPEGDTRKLKINDHLEERSEVMVEEGGSATLNDYFDATYHLVGGGHMKFFKKSVQLKRGKTWIQAHNPSHNLALTTANGHVSFWKSEFITTFDQVNSRSQVLVVNGDVEVSNILDKELKYAVPAGTFTLVDPEVENGIPRAPTKVGLSSLNSALAEFKRLPDEMIAPTKAAAPQRGIASVTETSAPTKRGEIIFITTQRHPASVGDSAHGYYQKKAFKKKAKASTAPIKFYGVKASANRVNYQAPRSPASVQIQRFVPQKAVEKVNIDPEFGESLKKQVQEQPKHSKELESLIQDLKSY